MTTPTLDRARRSERPSVDTVLAYLRRAGAPHEPPPAEEVVVDTPSRRTVRHRRRRSRRNLALGVALVATLVSGAAIWQQASGPGEGLAAPAASPYALQNRDPYTTLVAHARVPAVRVFAEPRGDAPATRLLEHPSDNGVPLVFMVQDDSHADWLEVQLPVRPNGTTGWISRGDVTIRETRIQVRVLVDSHRLEVYDGPELVMHAAIAVGTQDTPTPGGRFFVKELVQPPTDDTIYGNYVFGLSGFSNVVERFNGGEGVIGIHGTNEPEVIGEDVSRGCVRLANADMERLVGLLPLGAPVEIVAG